MNFSVHLFSSLRFIKTSLTVKQHREAQFTYSSEQATSTMANQLQCPATPKRYKTTRPVFPLTLDRSIIETRVNDNTTIQLRRFEPTDLEHAHRLRTQEAVMTNTSTGIRDADLNVSQEWMNRFLPPNDVSTFDLMLWVKHRDEPWEHIGVLGCHILEPVPHVGYMLRTEWWGKGIATKALQAFLRAWWALERRMVEVDVQGVEDKHQLHLMKLEWSQSEQEGDVSEVNAVPEILLAEVEERNLGSVKVVERCGFQYRDREPLIDDRGSYVLLDYTASKPAAC